MTAPLGEQVRDEVAGLFDRWRSGPLEEAGSRWR